MRLPHQPPLVFAKKLIKKKTDSAVVLCEFSCVPTLPMLLEAAAQSTIVLQDKEGANGMLVGAKDVKLEGQIEGICFEIEVKQETSFGSFTSFSFSIPKVASGGLSIYVS